MTDSKSLRSLIAENPSMLLLLGACPALAATADVRSALGMSLTVIVVLVLSSLLLSALRKLIPACAVIPAVFLVTAGITSVADLFLHACFPSVYQLLGVYIAALAVVFLVFACGENALRLRADKAVGESLILGLQLMAIMLMVASFREVLGSASFAGVEIPALKDCSIPVLAQSSGAFMVLGLAAAVLNRNAGKPSAPAWFSAWLERFEEKTEVEDKEEESAT